MNYPLQTTVLERNGKHALLVSNGKVEPFIIAHYYDEETKTWSYGTYFQDFREALKEWDRLNETEGNKESFEVTKAIWTAKDNGPFNEWESWNSTKLEFISQDFAEDSRLRDGDLVEAFEQGKDEPFLTIEIGKDSEDYEALYDCVKKIPCWGDNKWLVAGYKKLFVEVVTEDEQETIQYFITVDGVAARI